MSTLKFDCPVYFDGERFVEGKSIFIEGERIVRGGEAQRIFVLGDCVILPGFIDTHAHLAHYGLGQLLPNLHGTTSLDEALEVVKVAVENNYELFDFFIFEGFDEERWSEGRLPTREELDRIEKKKPLILRRICGHVAVGNTGALRRLKEAHYDFESGLIRERAALRIRKYFPPSYEELKLAVLKGQEEVIKLGITTVHEFGDGQLFKVYRELKESGNLKIRVVFHFYESAISGFDTLGIMSAFGDDRLRIGGVKTFADGSVGARTAAFKDPYSGKRGLLLKTEKELIELIRWGEERGVSILIHAIGDRAIERVVTSFSRALEGGNPLRHRIEHFEFPEEKHIERVSKLGLLLSMQPNFVVEWGEKGKMYERLLGDRFKRNNPFRAIVQSGIKLAFGSDSMPFGPLYGMKGAIFHPVEEFRVDVETALRLYTREGGYFSYMEGKIGVIKEGAYADIVIMRRDDLNSFNDSPLFVMRGGEVVYTKGSSLNPSVSPKL